MISFKTMIWSCITVQTVANSFSEQYYFEVDIKQIEKRMDSVYWCVCAA